MLYDAIDPALDGWTPANARSVMQHEPTLADVSGVKRLQVLCEDKGKEYTVTVKFDTEAIQCFVQCGEDCHTVFPDVGNRTFAIKIRSAPARPVRFTFLDGSENAGCFRDRAYRPAELRFLSAVYTEIDLTNAKESNRSHDDKNKN